MIASTLFVLFTVLAAQTPAGAAPPPAAPKAGTPAAAANPTPIGATTKAPSPDAAKAGGEQAPKTGQTPKATVDLLTPVPLDVTTNHGIASMPFRLLISGDPVTITKIEATAAVADGQVLPGTVTVSVGPSMTLQGDLRVQSALLMVQATPPLAQNVKFSGLLLVPGLGRVPYSVTDRTNVVLSSSPDRLAVTRLLWQPDQVRLQVRNSGTTPVTLTGASASLQDPGSNRRVETDVPIRAVDDCNGQPEPDCRGRLVPGQPRDILIDLPRPPFAGSYAGTLALRSESDSFSIPLVITTRGPSPGGYAATPFLLFLATLALGIYLSSKLDMFFGDGGGLRRAETVLALATLEKDLELAQASLEKLAQPPLALPEVLARFGPLRDAVQRARTVPNTAGIEALMTEARTAQLAGTLLHRLVATALPALKSDPAAVAAASSAIEALVWPVDEAGLKTFDAGLRAALEKAHNDMLQRAQAIGPLGNQPGLVQDPGPLALPPGTPTSPDDARRQIERMTTLQNAAIWFVTALTAYQTFYAANAAFGTAVHYGAVFMWALGLTQAGTQIVTRARRPANG